ncbi:hypothetical protein INT45_008792 [Circinella minor]|uniref:LYR motif-containing protein 2 n=1 Tax=Circinella minor TaxID=1195481 RepID=A0A8H7VEP0_9FUNG|nr:hypothetical protein INT45_008792 [Circinella minor]KAI7856513.1 hypothetical protein BDC45DRAFT_502925 [Circinella umbellata]
MRSTALRLASQVKTPPPVPRFFKDPQMSLAHFMIKGQVISLYRQILRCGKKLDKRDKQEIRDFARADFERYRNEKDLDKIRSLLSSGKQQMHSLQASVQLAHADK